MTPLSRRESEVLDCVYRLDKPTAKEVMHALDDGASYSTIRTLLRNLVEKGWLSRKEQSLKYLYIPTVKRKTAARKAIKKLLSTFFENSPALAVNSLMDMESGSFSEEEIQQLESLLAREREQLKENN